MKKIIVILFVTIFFTSQAQTVTPSKFTANNKGKFYVYWGGNRESFSRSNIQFIGDNYNFTLYDVVAHDKPKGWHIDYLNPGRMTIPETNFRMGYFINNHYNISLGLDHMKYVMYQNKAVNYSGYYQNQGTYGETLPNGQLLLTEDFLTFEHTDGLNYINSELCRFDDISKIFKIQNTDKFQINLTEGVGTGILYPKTNAQLFSQKRHDDFHVSGYGISAKIGLNFTFYKYFFIQTELKGGYINMNDIRTTYNSSDKAKQEFYFLQRIIAFGGIFNI
jgi:hypothetical protein